MLRINTEIIATSCDSLKSENTRLSNLVSELEDSIRAVGGMKGMGDVLGVLRNCKGAMEDEQYRLSNYMVSLERIHEYYMRSENQIIQNADGSFVKYRVYKTGLIQTPQISEQSEMLINNLII